MALCAIVNVAVHPCCTLSRNYDSLSEKQIEFSPSHSPDELWDKSLKKKKEASRSGFVYSAFKMIILVLRNFWLNKLQITAL